MSEKKNAIDIGDLQALNPTEVATLVTVVGTTPNRITTLKAVNKDGDELIFMTKKD